MAFSEAAVKKIGLIVNPVAGMGGSVGLKGTDGGMHLEAARLGAKPVAPARTEEFLSHLRHRRDISLLVAPGDMGETCTTGFDAKLSIVGSTGSETTAADTERIARLMLERGVDLLCFVGGDGTARNIHDAVGLGCPVVGIPSGVKVYSSVFALNPRAAAAMVDAFIDGTELSEEEVLDIDEDAFRHDILDAKLYGYLRVPSVKQLRQAGKEASSRGASNIENQAEIGEYVAESMAAGTLYLLGPGSTVKAVAEFAGVDKTLLGVDAVVDGKLVGSDLNEKALLRLLAQYPLVKVIVTPLGGNGFILGRGNRQFTPQVLRRVGRENLIVVATEDKLDKLENLRVDTGDYELDRELAGYIDVVVGYRFSKVLRVEC